MLLLLSSLVLHKMFHCKRIESPSNFRLDEFNQIQWNSMLVSLSKISNSKRMHQCRRCDFADQKNKLLNQAYSARRRCWCYCVLRRCFSLQEKGMTVKLSITIDGNNAIKSKTTFVGEHTTNLTLNKWVNAYVVILPNEFRREVHLLLWSSFPNSLPNFFTATYFKDRPADGKISTKCRANLLAKHWIH